MAVWSISCLALVRSGPPLEPIRYCIKTIHQFTVLLLLTARPYFPFDIGDRLVDPGQTVSWRCKAVARPKASYSWYKNGEPLRSVPGVIEIYRDYLKILNVDAARDEGMYQCGATNVHGTTYSYGQLKVLCMNKILSSWLLLSVFIYFETLLFYG